MSDLGDRILRSRFEVVDPADWLAQYRDVNPEPRFDRVAVRDAAVFDSIPRKEPPPRYLGGPALEALFGIPVVVDETVECGVVELRLGDQVVERLPVA